MPVTIRLSRVGRNKICRYRVVVADSRVQRDGMVLETIGTYNPQAQPKEFLIKTNRVAYWIEKGAKPTETVRNLLKEDRYGEKVAATKKGLDPATISRKTEPAAKKKNRKAPKAD